MQAFWWLNVETMTRNVNQVKHWMNHAQVQQQADEGALAFPQPAIILREQTSSVAGTDRNRWHGGKKDKWKRKLLM